MPSNIHSEVALHSLRNPQKQAEKFIDAKLENSRPGLILLIGAGRGYIINAIKKKIPAVRILPFYFCNELASHYLHAGGNCWYPELNQNCHEFLSINATDIDLLNCQIIEWLPSFQLKPQIAAKVIKEVADYIKKESAAAYTSGKFGKTWLENAIRNSLMQQIYLKPKNIPESVIITAAGPSLEQSVDIIKKLPPNRISVWALSSSLLYLHSRGVKPDAIVSSDGGFYSSYHFEKKFEKKNESPLITSLTARIANNFHRQGILLSCQQLLFERQLFNCCSLIGFYLPASATVAALALFTAMACQVKNIIFCGLDLAHNDIKQHARPHAFDQLFFSGNSRFKPIVTQLYHRYFQNQTFSPYSSYFEWFKQIKSNLLKKINIYQISVNSQTKTLFQTLEKNDLIKLLSTSSSTSEQIFQKVTATLSFTERKQNIFKLLTQWKNELLFIQQKPNIFFDNRKQIVSELLYYLAQNSLKQILLTKNINEKKHIIKIATDQLAQHLTNFVDKIDKLDTL